MGVLWASEEPLVTILMSTWCPLGKQEVALETIPTQFTVQRATHPPPCPPFFVASCPLGFGTDPPCLEASRVRWALEL